MTAYVQAEVAWLIKAVNPEVPLGEAALALILEEVWRGTGSVVWRGVSRCTEIACRAQRVWAIPHARLVHMCSAVQAHCAVCASGGLQVFAAFPEHVKQQGLTVDGLHRLYEQVCPAEPRCLHLLCLVAA